MEASLPGPRHASLTPAANRLTMGAKSRDTEPKVMAGTSFLASFGLILKRLLVAQGIDWPEFARTLGLPSQPPPTGGQRLPSALLDRAFASALQTLPNPDFALAAAAHWHPSHLGALGYAWLSSPDLRSALNRLVRYAALLGNRSSIRLAGQDQRLTLRFDSGRGDTAVGHAMADFALSLLVSMCQHNHGPGLVPLEVTLRRPHPSQPERWQRHYACPVRFGAAEDGFSLSAAVADAALATADPELVASLDATLTRQLAALVPTEPQASDWTRRCKAALLQALTAGEPDETRIAAELALSPRSLQRRLAAEGSQFHTLVNETRHALAREYLSQPDKSLTEIAFLLGFSEPSAFSRAFRRWQGIAPSAYRQMQTDKR